MGDISLAGWMRALIAYVRSGEPDLTNRQMALLMLVYLTPGPHTVRGLAKVLGVSKPVVTRALNTLGALGYLRRERDQDDRRNVFVVRTSNGTDFLEGFKRNLREGDRRRRPIGQSSANSPPSRTSADGFALSGRSEPARPEDQRLSSGLGRRRPRGASHRVPLCRADRKDRGSQRAASSGAGRRCRRAGGTRAGRSVQLARRHARLGLGLCRPDRRVGYVRSELGA